MSLNTVFFENSALHICYEDKKFKASNKWLKETLELFWNHPSIKKIFLIRRSKNGFLLSKRLVLDKEKIPRPVFHFIKIENGRK